METKLTPYQHELSACDTLTFCDSCGKRGSNNFAITRYRPNSFGQTAHTTLLCRECLLNTIMQYDAMRVKLASM